MKILYIIDFKGNLSPKSNDVMNRHHSYGLALNNCLKSTGNTGKIVALGRYDDSPSFSSNEFQVFNLGSDTPNLKYFWQARQIISASQDSSVALVAGDPWVSMLLALAIKVSIKKQVKIETQIHFEFAGFFKSKGLGIRLLIKPLVLRALRYIQHVRVVDEATLVYLQNTLPKSQKIYLAPSILNIDEEYSCSRNHPTLEVKLLFVGRLHAERNPFEFLKILKMLEDAAYPYRAKIVGEGSMRGILEGALSDLVLAGKIEFMGQLDQVDLFSEYCSADILVSTATTESYGRALREAVYFGARILSSDTVGLRSLKEELGSSFSETISGIETTGELISKIEKLKRVQIDSSIRQEIEAKDKAILQILGNKWTILLDS